MIRAVQHKGLTTIMFLASLAMLVFGLGIATNLNTNYAGALEQDDTVLTVQKISRSVDTSSNDLSNGYIYNNELAASYYTQLHEINKQDFEMLNNFEADKDILDANHTSGTSVENMLISFGNQGSGLYWLNATARLNGVAIDTSGTISEEIVSGESLKSFNHSLDLKTLSDIEGQPFTDLEGYYEYEFTYRFIDSLGTVSEELTKSFSFWLLDENSYVNTQAQSNLQPKMYNTEKIARDNYSSGVERNFFNFNNFNTTDLYNPENIVINEDELLFPTFMYDASRYNIAYTKSLYGDSTLITSDFIINNDGVGQISFYEEDQTTPFKTDEITPTNINGVDYYIYDNLELSDIADYLFTVSYTYKVSNTEFVLADTERVYEPNKRDNDVSLNVFGHQLYYSKDNIYDEEFKNETQDSLTVTDYSYDNKTYIENYDTVNWQPGENQQLNIPNEVATTNQAPVFLKTYGALKYSNNFTTSRSFYNHYPSGDTAGSYEENAYTNNTRFTQNGYYEVVVIYDFQKYDYINGSIIEDGNQITHIQVFAFKIANLPPEVSITSSEGENITSGKFTSADYVQATWSVGGVFDVSPHARLYRQHFDGYNPYTQSNLFNGAYYNTHGEPYEAGTDITNNGHYTLEIFYGPSTNTSIIYKFTIDQMNIDGFTVFGVEDSYDNNDNVVYLKDNSLDLTGKAVVNTPFSLDWNSKASGANISAKYSFTSLAEQTNSVPTLINQNNNEWVTNGYQTLSTFDNLTYNKTTTSSNVLNANSVLKNSSIYVFTLTDQANNVYTYYVVLDDTKAEMIQQPEAVSKYNFVPTQTTITWGTHKAIEVSDLSNIPSEVITNSSLFEIYNGTLYLVIPIETVSVYSADLNKSDDLLVENKNNLSSIENNRRRTFTKDDNFQSSITFYTGLEDNIPTEEADLAGEQIYNIYVTDNSSIGQFNDLSYDNISFLDLKMNLDRSQGHSETAGIVKNTGGEPAYTLLQQNRGSNRQFLYFNFKDSNDDYQIQDLTYDFYPLTFEQDSPNYPFASVSTLTEDILTNKTLVEGDLYRSQALNVVFSTDYATDITMPGMYVITRTYVGDINEQETGDTKVKQYTYYIDRHDVIEQLDNYLVGEHIKVSLGELNGREPVIFDDFLVTTTKETLLETNLLPVAIEIPQNKYSVYNELTSSFTQNISSFDLQVSILRRYRNSSGTQSTETIYPLGISNGLILLPDFYKDGVYEVLINDKTGYGSNSIGANEFRFSFEITSNRPTGEFYGTPYNEQDIQLVNVSSTNEENLKFKWQDPADIYSAKIDADNLTLTQEIKGTNQQNVIYQVVNGAVVTNEYNFEITQQEIGTLIGSNDTIARNEYSLQIFTENDQLSAIEADYSVNLKYEGLEQHYVYEGNNFYTNTLTMTIDKTAPKHNLNELITQDNYLTDNQKQNIKDNQQEINAENYAFAIDRSFNFTTANIAKPAQDTYQIYYRKYNKYDLGEQNLQSLIPGDENYSQYQIQPTRPRFNPANDAYNSFGYNLGNFADQVSASDGNYYEIIEIDEAGNHTIYSVQVILFEPAIEGKILNYFEEDLEEGQSGEFETFERDANNNEVIDALDLEIDNIIYEDLWYYLNITNNASNISTTLAHTPQTNYNDFINQINSVISHTTQTKVLGASYEFNLLSRVNQNINFTYNAQGDVLEPSFTDYENTFEIVLPEHTASTTIEEFAVYQSINGVFEETQDYEVLYDMNGVAIDNNGASGAVYEFVAGEYYFYFLDNFNRSYLVPKIFGLIDIADVYYDGATEVINNQTYTADDVRVVYQTELYSVEIQKNGETYSNVNITTEEETGIQEIWLKDIATEPGLQDEYSIIITNSAGTTTIYDFTIYTVVPEVTLTDSLDNSLNYLIEDQHSNKTTKPVYISYNNTTLFPYDVMLEVDMFDENNNTSTKVYNTIDPEFGYYMTGNYRLIFTNSLGTRMIHEWDVQESATVIYSVIADVNGIDKLLPAADIKYDYNGNLIDQYISIYQAEPIKNPDRNLTIVTLAELEDTERNSLTKIYRIYNDYYEKTFAVTLLPENTNFLQNSLEINGYVRGVSNYKTTANPTSVSWNSYYLFEGNYIYAEYYFNQNYVGEIHTDSVDLQDAGVYHFKFFDFAGNAQMFGTQDSYEILLIDEVLFSVNEQDPINDMIYNEPVSLRVEYISEYDDRREINVSATLNGDPVTLLRVNNDYIFEDYGLYQITLSAPITLPGEVESQTITTEHSFMILNPNEARLSFEYTPQTGYEITNVSKDGIDVTNSFKEEYNSNTLTSLFLSPDAGGNGNYVVTVKAGFTSLKPSQTFNFNVWINNEQPLILSNIEEGSTTTKNIMLTFNKYLIYQQVGESVITVNGEEAIVINSETSNINQVTNYELSENDDYIVQLQTNSENTVISFKVIKRAPLNSIAIFLIIAGIFLVATLTFIFIRLRTKMRVS